MNNVIKKTAKKFNVSEHEVLTEISNAIRISMQCDSLESKKLWSDIAPDGKVPSPETFIRKIKEQCQKR